MQSPFLSLNILNLGLIVEGVKVWKCKEAPISIFRLFLQSIPQQITNLFRWWARRNDCQCFKAKEEEEASRKTNEPWICCISIGENAQNLPCAVVLKTLSLMFKRRAWDKFFKKLWISELKQVCVNYLGHPSKVIGRRDKVGKHLGVVAMATICWLKCLGTHDSQLTPHSPPSCLAPEGLRSLESWCYGVTSQRDAMSPEVAVS